MAHTFTLAVLLIAKLAIVVFAGDLDIVRNWIPSVDEQNTVAETDPKVQYYSFEFYYGLNCNKGTFTLPGWLQMSTPWVFWAGMVVPSNNANSITRYMPTEYYNESTEQWHLFSEIEGINMTEMYAEAAFPMACQPPQDETWIISYLHEEKSLEEVMSRFNQSYNAPVTLTNYGDECINTEKETIPLSYKWVMKTTDDCSDSDSSKLSTGAIIGISVGGVTVIALLTWLWYRKPVKNAQAAKPASNLVF